MQQQQLLRKILPQFVTLIIIAVSPSLPLPSIYCSLLSPLCVKQEHTAYHNRLTTILLIEKQTPHNHLQFYSSTSHCLRSVDVVNDFKVHHPALLISNGLSTAGFMGIFVMAINKCQLNVTLPHFISAFQRAAQCLQVSILKALHRSVSFQAVSNPDLTSHRITGC